MLTLGAAVFAVIEAGRYGPSAPSVMAAVVAVLALAGFVVAERRAANPMLPPALLRRPAFATANAVAGAMNLGTLGLLFLLTLYLQTVQHQSALLAGADLLPLFLPPALLAPLTGRVVARWAGTGVDHQPACSRRAGTTFTATGRPTPPTRRCSRRCWAGAPDSRCSPPPSSPPRWPARPTAPGSPPASTTRRGRRAGRSASPAYGVLAGPPAAGGTRPCSGLHAAGLATAGLFATGALVSLTRGATAE